MSINFTKPETLAIMSVVIDMTRVDGQIHPNEAWIVVQLSKKFSLGNTDIIKAQNIQPAEVASIISAMSWEKKELVSYILASTAAIDGFVDQNESSMYYYISQNCNLITSEIDYDAALKAVQDFIR